MQIIKDLNIVNLALYIKSLNSLVLGDVHIGYEEELNKRGVLIPRHHFKDVLASLNHTFYLLEPLLKKSKKKKLSNIIINGDLKHEFGLISNQEWREILKFFDILSKHCEKIILVKGNHDPIIGPVAKKRNIKVVDDYSKDGIFICHGHQIPTTDVFKKSKLLIIGNEHPAVSIKEGPRSETFKCFLKGTFKNKDMIVMPSFNPITIGTDVLKEQFISPFLNQDINSFEVFVIAGNVYYFGKVKDLK
ncbi:phosphoesterase [Candidatus Woesearchaeota archaeon]|nr:phosphoesterase [Candidatus Woesearchaeota archaeon]|tara:strand:+ start:4144 stop:4884 length:741 start_codon:yes stop_codon:yes gene_type:complete